MSFLFLPYYLLNRNFVYYQHIIETIMFKKVLHSLSITLFLNCLSLAVYSQTITGVTVSFPTGVTAYCSGGSAVVVFTPASFTGTPTFTIELSSSAGSFTTPTVLGTTAASPVTVTLPTSLSTGAGYSVRVTSGVTTSAGSAAITITATPAPPMVTTPVNGCVGATSPALSATGTAVKWYTVSSGGVGSATTPTPSTAAVATFNYYTTQTVSGCESSSRANIVVNINASPAAPAITSAANYCVGGTGGSLVATGTAIKWYDASLTLISTPSVSTTSANGPTTYSASQTVSGCESAKTATTITVFALPAAPAITSAANYCVGGTGGPLVATGTAIKWYDASLAVISMPSVSTTSANGPTTYSASQTVSGCESAKTAITITVFALPAAPAATTSYVYCQNATTATALSATATSGNSLRFYTVSTGGTFVTTAPTPSTATATTLNYYVSQITALGCESPRTTITVTINATPAPPTVTSPVIYCQTYATATLTATAIGSNTLKWYTTVGGTASATAPTPTSTASGTTNYYVSQSNAFPCESPVETIAIIVNPTPAAPTATASYIYCQNDIATALSATAATGNTLRWYTVSTGGSFVTTAPTPSTTAAAVLNYYVSQITALGCESPRTAITIRINATPVAAPTTSTPILLCQGQTATALVATASTGNSVRWYTVSTSGTTISAPTPNTAVGSTTSNTYYVTQVNANNCEFAPRTAVTTTVNVTNAPAITATLPVIACQNQGTPALSSYITPAVSGFSLVYYGTDVMGGTGTGTATAPSTATLGTTSYYVVQKNLSTNCESTPRTSVSVLVNAVPSAPGVTSPVNICNNAGTSALSGSFIPGGTALWYGTNATGGTSSGASTVPSSASVGNTTYYVSQLVSGCESARAAITVTINPIPAVPSASSAVYCQNDGATAMNASPSTGNSLKWYDGAGNYTGTSAPTPNTNIGGNTTYTYKVSQVTPSPAFCESPQSTITALVNFTPAPSVSNVTYCQNSNTTPLTATPSSGGSISWYSAATGSSSSGTAPIPSSANVGVTDYYVTQRLYVSGSFGGCENIPRTLIQVNVNPQPAPPSTTTAITYCQTYPSSQLTANGTNLKWYNSFPNSALNGAPTPSTAGLAPIVYYVTQTNGFNCESNPTTINITVNATPIAPPFTNSAFCQNYPATPLLATASIMTNTVNWYGTNFTGGTASLSAPTPPTQNVGTTYYYASQITNLGCESPRSTITVLINPTPIAPTTNTNVEYCQFEATQPLTANAASGNSLKWYTFSLNPLPNAPTISTQIGGQSQFFVSQITSVGCESPKTQISYIVKDLPVIPTQLITEYLLCQFDPSLTLSAGGTALRWYYPNNTASATAPTITTGNGVVADYGVTQTVDGCESRRLLLTVKVRVTPRPVVSTEPVVFCQNATVANLSATGTDIKWYNGTRAPVSGATYGVFTQIPGTYDFYATQTDATTKCESDKAKVVAVIQPLPTATISGETSLTQGQSATLKIEFSGQGPWTYTLSNGFTGTATVNQNPTTVTITPLETTIYTVSKITNNCGDGTPLGTATINVKTSTVSTGNPNTASLCAGKTFTVPYFSSDFVPANAVFSVQISKTNIDADFKTILTQGNVSPLTATIPASTLGGNYYIRVLGSAPNISIKGQVSPVQISVRELPNATISGPASIYENETAKMTIALSGESPWTLVYSDSLAQKNTTLDLMASPYELTITAPKTNTYSVLSVTNACGNGSATSKYRLKVSPLLSVNPASSNADWIIVFPNPVQDKVIVDFGNNTFKQVATISILDGSGRLVRQQQSKQNQTEISLRDLSVGEYFLQVEQNGKIAHRKIMKIE
jgi:hypothetical protein